METVICHSRLFWKHRGKRYSVFFKFQRPEWEEKIGIQNDWHAFGRYRINKYVQRTAVMVITIAVVSGRFEGVAYTSLQFIPQPVFIFLVVIRRSVVIIIFL